MKRAQQAGPPEERGATHTEDLKAKAGEGKGPRQPVKSSTADFPDKVGRFTVLDMLGRGGMGVVYAAFDEELGRKVAVKLLHDRGTLGNTRRNRRFLREAQAMAKLSHPNVVTIYEVGLFEGKVYIAMEYVRGVTLKRWMRDRLRPWEEVLNVCCAAGEGLRAAHESGLIHRDFKPENVLLGRDGRVRVLDFGLARQLDTSDGLDNVDVEASIVPDVPRDFLADEITVPGAVVGTPAYMAPEQHLGDDADARSDQFSFCVTIWEALYGRRPFEGKTLAVIGERVLAGELRAPPKDSRVPTWVRRVVERGMARDADRRFPSIDSLLRTLTELNASTDHSRGAVYVGESLSDVGTSSSEGAMFLADRYQVLGGGTASTTSRYLRVLDRLRGTQAHVREISVRERSAEEPGAGSPTRRELLRQVCSFRHPNVVGVIDCAMDDRDHGFVVLNIKDSPRPVLESVGEVPFAIRIGYVVQLLHAVRYLHQRGAYDALITPETVGIVDGSVKVFELLYRCDDAGSVVSQEHRGYVAPECLAGAAAVPSSLLYSVGMFGLALLEEGAGALHVDPDEASWLTEGPAAASGDYDETHLKVRDVFVRMTDGIIAARLQTVGEALDAISSATARVLEAEPLEIRESLLQAGDFFGRARAIKFMRALLEQAYEDDAGAMVLVAGESGVGKSRLKREVWGYAVSEGFRTLEGQGVSNGAHPFHIWREVLKGLLLSISVDAEEASVLSSVITDIDMVLGASVERGLEFDASAMHARFIEVAHRVVRRIDRPTLLIFEDLQWARSESLALLRAVEDSLADVPVLILATYRDDDARRFEHGFDGASYIELGRLDRTEIGEVAGHTLSVDAVNTELIDFLSRESEGNPFFLVETLRSLADQHGGLASLSQISEIKHATAGGIRKSMRRRLARLSSDDVQVLQVAAICGRAIDFDVLEPFVSGEAALAWAKRCEESAVLAVTGDKWSFAHDKLREAVIEYMPEERRISSHKVLAESMEGRFADVPGRAAAIAHHHAAAGHTAKEAYFSGIGGEHALGVGAHVEGAKLLERALAVRASEHWSPVRLSMWRRELADVYVQIGDHERAKVHLRLLLRSYRRRSVMGRVGLVLRGVCGQLMGRFLRPLLPAPAGERRRYLMDLSRGAATHSAICVYDNDLLGLAGNALLAANLGDRVKWVNLASYGMLGSFAAAAGLTKVAERYFTTARASRPAPSDERDLVMLNMSEVAFHTGRGKLGLARERARSGALHSRSLADRRGVAIFEHQLAMIAMYKGRLEAMLAHAMQGAEILSESAARSSDVALITRTVGLAYYVLGRHDDGVAYMSRHSDGVPQDEALTVAAFDTTRALLLSGVGRVDEAVQCADESLARWTNSAVLTASNPQYLSGMLEAYMAAARIGIADGRDVTPWIRKCERVLRYHRQWAKGHPVGVAQERLYQAKFFELRGERELALTTARQCVEVAAAAELTYFEAMGMAALARWSYQRPPFDTGVLDKAYALMERVGARAELSRLRDIKLGLTFGRS